MFFQAERNWNIGRKRVEEVIVAEYQRQWVAFPTGGRGGQRVGFWEGLFIPDEFCLLKLGGRQGPLLAGWGGPAWRHVPSNSFF